MIVSCRQICFMLRQFSISASTFTRDVSDAFVIDDKCCDVT